tara:strand:+ start:702 stop:956 length:255 start_codon:yes stop_codon:yes gene_type:complete
MKNFLIGCVMMLLLITSIAGIVVNNKLNNIQDSLNNLHLSLNELSKDNNIKIKTNDIDSAVNEFMINAFNAANEELKKNMGGTN